MLRGSRNPSFQVKDIQTRSQQIQGFAFKMDKTQSSIGSPKRAATNRIQVDFECKIDEQIEKTIYFFNNFDKDVLMKLHWTLGENGSCFSGNKDFAIKKNTKGSYTITFKPKWVICANAILSMTNSATKEVTEYSLVGRTLEPPIEELIKLECKAGRIKVVQIPIKNFSQDRTSIFRIQHNIKYYQGSDSHKVKASGIEIFEFEIHPKIGETYVAYLRLIHPYHQIWYKLSIVTEKSPPEDTIELATYLRKTSNFQIAIDNYLDEVIEYDVSFRGEGLTGNDKFILQPKQRGNYKLIFSPLRPINMTGSISFVNQKLGEIWYELKLKAENPPPVRLDPLKAEVGSLASRFIEIENPIDKPIVVFSTLSNTTNFAVEPSEFFVEPFSVMKVKVIFVPTKLVMTEGCQILFESKDIGNWIYLAFGQGIPSLRPTISANNGAVSEGQSATLRSKVADPNTKYAFAKEEIHFHCPAYGKTEKTIPLSPSSYQDIVIRAIFLNIENGECFGGPREVLVKTQNQTFYTITFSPQWILTSSARLQLLNLQTNECLEYELRGFGEEPEPVEHITYNFPENSTSSFEIPLKNPYDNDITYKIETDIKNMKGPKTIQLRASDTSKAKFDVTVNNPGIFAGQVKFIDNLERYIIYSIEIRSEANVQVPTNNEDTPTVQKLDFRARVRKALIYYVRIQNPISEMVKFNVQFKGPDVFGERYFFLQPQEIGIYTVTFSPLSQFKESGQVILKNEKVGEVKLDLTLQSEENHPMTLPIIASEIGRIFQFQLTIENTSCHEAVVKYTVSNSKNFNIEPKETSILPMDKIFLSPPKDFILLPYESSKINLLYKASTAGTIDTAEIKFTTNKVGSWTYYAYGQGIVIENPKPKNLLIRSASRFESES